MRRVGGRCRAALPLPRTGIRASGRRLCEGWMPPLSACMHTPCSPRPIGAVAESISAFFDAMAQTDGMGPAPPPRGPASADAARAADAAGRARPGIFLRAGKYASGGIG